MYIGCVASGQPQRTEVRVVNESGCMAPESVLMGSTRWLRHSQMPHAPVGISTSTLLQSQHATASTQTHKHASHGHTPRRRTRQGKTETQRQAAAAALRGVRAPTSLPAHRRLPAATRPRLADPVCRRSMSARRGRSWHALPSRDYYGFTVCECVPSRSRVR